MDILKETWHNKTTDLANIGANREYYKKSDGIFWNSDYTRATQSIKRLSVVRDMIYKIKGKYLLDVGCKDGYFPLQLAQEGRCILGIDPSADAIEVARNRALAKGLSDRAIFSVGFFEDIAPSLQEKQFEIASACEVLEHVTDDHLFLSELARVAYYAIISTPDVNGYESGLPDAEARNQEHVRLYSLESLCSAMDKAGFKIVESRVIGGNLFVLGRSRV